MEHEKQKVSVTVQYVGKNDYVDPDVPGSQDLQAIKVHAMKVFELNPGDASRYVLQFNGADVSDKTKIGQLGTVVVLKLVLAEEVAKG
jgi:hypothetical protein